MEISEAQREAAIGAEDTLRDREVARIRAAMCLKGDEFCQDCGEDIGAKRRAVMPSATRCIGCQNRFEAGGR